MSARPTTITPAQEPIPNDGFRSVQHSDKFIPREECGGGSCSIYRRTPIPDGVQATVSDFSTGKCIAGASALTAISPTPVVYGSVSLIVIPSVGLGVLAPGAFTLQRAFCFTIRGVVRVQTIKLFASSILSIYLRVYIGCNDLPLTVPAALKKVDDFVSQSSGSLRPVQSQGLYDTWLVPGTQQSVSNNNEKTSKL